MIKTGGCRCGVVRYETDGEPKHYGLCHCDDCRRSSGAPMVAFMAVPSDSFRVTRGEARRWDGNNGAQRFFCGQCGTPLYYINETMLPGIVDFHTVTLDDPELGAPQAQIQCAERLSWAASLNDIPEFERFPAP